MRGTDSLFITGRLEVHLVVSDVETACPGSQEWVQVGDVVGWINRGGSS